MIKSKPDEGDTGNRRFRRQDTSHLKRQLQQEQCERHRHIRRIGKEDERGVPRYGFCKRARLVSVWRAVPVNKKKIDAQLPLLEVMGRNMRNPALLRKSVPRFRTGARDTCQVVFTNTRYSRGRDKDREFQGKHKPERSWFLVTWTRGDEALQRTQYRRALEHQFQ